MWLFMNRVSLKQVSNNSTLVRTLCLVTGLTKEVAVRKLKLYQSHADTTCHAVEGALYLSRDNSESVKDL